MLEGVLHLGEEHLLVDQLRPLERTERSAQLLGWQLGDPRQHRLPELPADHRRRLENALLPLGQAVDASGEDPLDGRWNRDVLDGPGEPVGALRPGEGARLDERLHDLLDEEGVARRPLADAASEAVQ